MLRCCFDLPTLTLWLIPTVESSHTRFCTSPPFCIHDRYRRRVVIDLALAQRPPSVEFARIWCGFRRSPPGECQKAASNNEGSDACKSWFPRHQLKTSWTLLLNASPCGSKCEARTEFDRLAVLPDPSKVYSPSVVLHRVKLEFNWGWIGVEVVVRTFRCWFSFERKCVEVGKTVSKLTYCVEAANAVEVGRVSNLTLCQSCHPLEAVYVSKLLPVSKLDRVHSY